MCAHLKPLNNNNTKTHSGSVLYARCRDRDDAVYVRARFRICKNITLCIRTDEYTHTHTHIHTHTHTIYDYLCDYLSTMLCNMHALTHTHTHTHTTRRWRWRAQIVSKTAGAALTVVGHVIRGYSPATVVSVVREQVCLNACPPPPHVCISIYLFILAPIYS